MVGGSAEAMVGVLLFYIGINSYVGWCINSLGVVFDDKATRVILVVVIFLHHWAMCLW